MRYSEMFLPTAREVPSDAEIVSHQLMIRAGMIRKLMSGIYSYLPFGYRVIRKIEQIVREEMDRVGAQEVYLPMVQPRELWEESGRWTFYGKELLRFKDRHDRESCLGPTHEEVITDLVRHEVKTYRQLPRMLYQIQTKFRDEIRPRFGVMRGREFGMKDAYSFDADEAGVDISYGKMFEAYKRIFKRCGLNFRAVEADTGTIGGKYSHEFMVMADSGEDAITFCSACDYAANLEKAEVPIPEKREISEENFLALEEVSTPEVRKIEEVCGYLHVTPVDVVKTIIYEADGQPVAVLVRGDDEINETKVRNYLGCDALEMASEDMIYQVTGAPRGFSGPIGIKAKVVADYALMNMNNMVVGANKKDHHLKHANIGRDFKVEAFSDLRIAKDTDACPRCRAALKFARGIEVGHVFKLGTKYSKAMNAVYLDQNGKEQFMVMGCYGIGISRTAAASIEQNNDENGIIWPVPIAPYHVIISPVNVKDESVLQASESLYQTLLDRGVEVILDDRDERAGVKFNDADLLGLPLRITVGSKKIVQGLVEVKIRKSGEMKDLSIESVPEFVDSFIREAL
jgi:prolyl-tRNA synthetase